MAENHGEQPDDMRNPRLIGERDLEARSTWACSPGGVSKRTSNGLIGCGLISRTVRLTAV